MDFSEELLNCLPDAICVIDASTDKIKYTNKTFSDQLVSSHIVQGQAFEAQILQPDSKSKFIEALNQAKNSTNDVTVGLCKSLSSVGVDKFPVYKQYFWTLRKINDGNILLRGNLDTAKYNLPTSTPNGDSDQTSFNYTEELLDFFQNAPIALHWLSGTGHVLWANNIELETLGYSREEYIGHHIMEFCPDEELALTKVFTELSQGKTIRNAPFKFRTKTGELRYLIVDSNVNWNADGSFKHTRCFIRDDTQRKIQEGIKEMELKHVKAVSEAKDRFTRRIFHEIKTPLHVISYSVADIQESIKQNMIPNIDEVTSMQRNIDSILGTAEDVIFSVMFEEGRTITVNPKPFDLQTIVKDICCNVEALEARSSQRLHFDYSFIDLPTTTTNYGGNTTSAPCQVLVDSNVYRVFFHLVRNAVRFSPDDSKILFEIKSSEYDNSSVTKMRRRGNYGDEAESKTEVRENMYSFRITNLTITPIDIKSIHESFHNYYSGESSLLTSNANNTSNNNNNNTSNGISTNCKGSSSNGNDIRGLTSTQGVGLGLYVCYNLIQSMGGLLDCTASADGKSVCFHFQLKLNHVPTISSSSATAAVSAMQQSSAARVQLTNQTQLSSAQNNNNNNNMNSNNDNATNNITNNNGMSLTGTNIMSLAGQNSNWIYMHNSDAANLHLIGGDCNSGNNGSSVNGSNVSDNGDVNSARGSVTTMETSFTHNTTVNNTNNTNNNTAAAVTMADAEAAIIAKASAAVGMDISGKTDTTATGSGGCGGDEEKKLRILIVDDSPMCQRVLVRMLNKNGYETDTADNGQDALVKLSIEPCLYHVCLMDLRMPIMDGITATKLCREKQHLKNFPIVIITAELGEKIQQEAMDAGANQLISKPARSENIMSAIVELTTVKAQRRMACKF